MEILEHHFPTSVAIKYGVNIAIFLRDIYHWCSTNSRNNENFYEGRYWTFQTMKGLCQRHPYWSKNQVEYIIKTCKEKGLLLTGHFGEDQFNRTCWYALTDDGWNLFDIPISISENSEIVFGKSPNSDRKIQKCNNDKYKTKDITDNPMSLNSESQNGRQEIFAEVVETIQEISAPDDAGATRDAIIFSLNKKGFSCQHQAPVPQRSINPNYTGRVSIVAAKAGVVIGIEVDRKTPREKSIFKLREFKCDYRVIVLRTGKDQSPPVGIDAVVAIRDVQADQLFLTFWEKYPKKVKREDTYRVFQKLHVTEELLQQMLRALEIQKNSMDWKKEDGRYIPHATTWLNGRRWEDEEKVCQQVPPSTGQPLRGEGVRYL